MFCSIARILLLFPLLLAASFPARSQNVPEDPTVERRVENLLSQLTPEEKIGLLAGSKEKFNFLSGIPRLGIPDIGMVDGPVGVRRGKATAYPSMSALAATWDTGLACRFGKAIGTDTKERGMHVLLAPGVNIYRSPLCGRNFEYMGEDPFLSGSMASAEIRGIQSEGVAATVKHFAANNQESQRYWLSSDVDERTLREIYFPSFKAAVDAGVWCVMSGYNRLNGTFCSENGWLINDVLKKEWGFKGVHMSDWGATHDTANAFYGGLDIEMPTGKFLNAEKLSPLVAQDQKSKEILDDKVRRILRMIVANGWMEESRARKDVTEENPVSASVALEMVREGTVLLKNEKRLLPFDKAGIRKIALIGPNADPAVAGGYGSSNVGFFRATSLLEGLKQEAGKDTEIRRIPMVVASQYLETSSYSRPVSFGIKDGATSTVDRIAFDGPSANIKGRATWKTEIRPSESGNYLLALKTDRSAEGAKITLDGKILWDEDTICKYRKYKSVTGAVQLPVALEAGKSYSLEVSAGVDAKTKLKFGWGPWIPTIGKQDAEFVRQADAVVLSVGFGPDWAEGEATDRPYTLPGRQEELIKEAADLNPKTVVILTAGGSVATSGWIAKIPAFLHAWYPGQDGGKALAEILFGTTNPSGHLPISFEKKWEDCAAYPNYPTKDSPNNTYKEGIFIGYRWFDSKNIAPLFPFGYGLSYTTFDFSDLEVKQETGNWKVSLTVRNTGQRTGAEVVQIYVGQKNPPVERPVRELKGFARIGLRPGEAQRVSFMLPRDAFAFYDTTAHGWRVAPGAFVVEAGSSSSNPELRQTIDVP